MFMIFLFTHNFISIPRKMSRKSTFRRLQENNEEVFKEVFDILLKVLDNVIKAPTNSKYRKLRLGNEIVSTKLIPAIGALESLFEFGFEEADEFLSLPHNIPVKKMQQIRDEFIQCYEEYLVKSRKSFADTVSHHKLFFDEIRSTSKRVLIYENESQQTAARNVIPIDELKIRCSKRKSDDDSFANEFALVYELMNWFKHEFFKWMDAPLCPKCSVSSSFCGYSQRPEDLIVTNRVEEYSCPKCCDRLIFPRYNDPSILLETRSGRCGEWANCFCLLCRSLGFETRFVLDKTDHVWVEIFSKTQSRWVHCDPCENAIDSPLMYEKGWNKQLSYVLAFSREEVQDVTWRYTAEFEQVRARRKLCPEEDLVLFILKLSNELQVSLPRDRRSYLMKRRLHECIEMLTPSTLSGDYTGRTSGSLQWRLSRNETKLLAKNVIWEPNEVEVCRRRFHLKYFSGKNFYQRIENGDIIKGWENGVYEFDSIFRKEELDWRMTYLCRIENSEYGSIKWRFSSKNQCLPIDFVTIFYQCSTYHSGNVRLLLCNDEACLPLKTEKNSVKSYLFRGTYELSLTAMFTGGDGKDSWQHAQLFRQPLDCDETEFSFEIFIKFKE